MKILYVLFCISMLATCGCSTVRMKPRDKPRVRTIDKFDPVWWFGNADEPVPPDDYRPGKKSRNLTWHIRNPAHNFFFYVIGVADKETVRTGICPEDVFNPEGGFNASASRCGIIYLPFISYDGLFEFYFGWRERGNFGMALRP